MAHNGTRRYSFSVFTFDVESRELVRDGKRLRIRPQTAQVLTVLLERAGSVVTREELEELLWPDVGFADHEHAINRAISQLRSALRDNSQTPRFIETIAKRGYRFRAQATLLGSAPTPQPGVAMKPPTSVLQVKHSGASPATSRRRHMGIWALVSVSVLIVLTAGWLLSSHRSSTNNHGYIYMGIAPFRVEDAAVARLAESFRADLTDSVSQLPRVRVQAVHSLIDNQEDQASLRASAQNLRLDMVLFGKFVLRGNQCVLDFELVRGRDATRLASLHYTGTKQELATIRDRVQRDIFTRLELAGDINRPIPGGTTNATAYEAYLRARYYLSQWKDESPEKAVREFEIAVTEDPGFAKAYAGLASAYLVLARRNTGPTTETYAEARDLANKAISIDPLSAEAHSVLGQVAGYADWKLPVAERELRRAIELAPGEPAYHLHLAVFLGFEGRFQESLQQIDLAHANDPFWPPVYLNEISVADGARQHARAAAAAAKLVSLTPEWPIAFEQRGWMYWHAGQYMEAIRDWQHMATLEKDARRLELENRGLEAFRRGGVFAYARLRLQAIQSGLKWAHAETDFIVAEWYFYAGERDKAITSLQDMVNRRDLAVFQLGVRPAWRDLHSDSRVQEMLTKAGFPLFHS